MSDAMQQVYDNFPSYLQIENGIMDAVAIEKSTNTNITELTVGSPTAIDVNNPTGEAGTDSSSGSSSDSGTTDSSNADNSQSSQTADGSIGSRFLHQGKSLFENGQQLTGLGILGNAFGCGLNLLPLA